MKKNKNTDGESEQRPSLSNLVGKEIEEIGTTENQSDELDDISQHRRQEDHRRGETVRRHFNMIAVGALWLVGSLWAVAAMAITIQFVVPEDLLEGDMKWAMLSHEQAMAARCYVFSGLVIGTTSNYLRRNISS